MKKLLFALVAAVAPLLAAYGVDIEGINYTLNSNNGTAQVATQAQTLSGAIEIPEVVTYEGATYRVTSLVGSAFRETQIESISLPNGIIALSEGCFKNCTALTSIDLPNTITTIGDTHFENCTALRTVYVHWTSLDGVSAHENAFANIPSDACLYVPAGTIEIYQSTAPWSSFGNIEEEESGGVFIDGIKYTLSDDGTAVIARQEQSLTGAIEITEDVTHEGSTYRVTGIAYTAFSGTQIESISLPGSITTIGDRCFENCTALRTVYVHWTSLDGVSAHEDAFANLSSDACLYIPNGTIDSYIATAPWSNFSNIIEEDSGVAIIGGIKYTLSEDGTAVIARQEDLLTGTIEIPEEVTYDGSTYYRVTGIVEQAFRGTLIESISLPGGITSIGTECFYGCTFLTSIDLPESLTTIGGKSFYYCTNLTSIDLPNTITTIGEQCFEQCDGLTSISCHWTSLDEVSVHETALDGIPSTAPIYVPLGTKEMYQTTAPWSNFSNIVEREGIPVTIDGINYYIDGNAVIARQEQSLTGAIEITEVVTHEGSTYRVTGIVDEAFRETQIESITLPVGITTIGDYCFYGCTNLTSIALPDGITTVGENCFYGCSNLASIDLPENLTTIGENCFYGCTNLASIDLPDGITTIGTNCFRGCTNLASIALPESLTTIGNNCFLGCTALTSIDLPENLTTIGERCFLDCTNLTSIDLPESIKTIGLWCFSNCTNLNSVSCHWTSLDGVEVQVNAFDEVPLEEASLYVPTGTKEMYQTTAPWSSFGKILERDGSGSSISIQLETSLTVEQSGYEIAVSGAESGASVALYSIGGTLIGSATADSEGSARIATGGATGVVIVRAGSKSAKVMLK